MRSECCNAALIVMGSVTQFYVCAWCKNPCDAVAGADAT